MKTLCHSVNVAGTRRGLRSSNASNYYGTGIQTGEMNMGDRGKMDKGKKEAQKKPQLTLMEKRKKKNEKKKAK